MLVTIITSSYNHGHFIKDTIESVLNQDYENIEHIIVDGGSTDGTLAILKSYPHLKWVSEKDKGQSDAINKAFRLAQGDVFIWINSDDFLERNVIGSVVRYLETHSDCNLLYGNLNYVNNNKEPLYLVSGDVLSYSSLLRDPDLMREPAIFFTRKVIEDIGVLDESLHLVMDLDFFLRASKKFKFHYINKNIAYFRWDNHNKTVTMLDKQFREIWKVLHRQKQFLPFGTYKFLLGRYIDILPASNFLKRILTFFRKSKKSVL